MASLEEIDGWIDDVKGEGWLWDGWEVGKLRKAVEAALSLPKPKGDPDRLDGMAEEYRRVWARINDMKTDLSVLARRGIPEVWTGEAGAMASETVVAAHHRLDDTSVWFSNVQPSLTWLAKDLRSAQDWHAQAQEPLRNALKALGSLSNSKDLVLSDSEKASIEDARTKALEGMGLLQDAVKRAREAAEAFEFSTSALIEKYPHEAGLLLTDELSAAGRLVLADTALRLGESNFSILTDDQLKSAAQRLESMSAQDRDRFMALYNRTPDDPTTSEERAYLMKALATGKYSIDDIERFAQVIHQNGDFIPEWARANLSPTFGENGKLAWSVEGDDADLNPAQALVMGRAAVDPVYALRMATGVDVTNPEGFGSGSFDPDNFDQAGLAGRLHDEQDRILDGSRNFAERLLGSGMGAKEIRDTAGDMLASGEYQVRPSVDGDKWDHNLPDDVKGAIADGKPVIVTIEGGDEERTMALLPRGDEWVVYDPATGATHDYDLFTAYLQTYKDAFPYNNNELKVKDIYLPK
ncbi:hypothetical protein GCM10022226_07330 [Sphaerisporangium flaviroseum]|uniref:WXG100 family type VII secretion target n=1 Tax=Sphaerisporangium flaviroseum TaxID=509199 RepID=A0ABP7HK48_9ACTN